VIKAKLQQKARYKEGKYNTEIVQRSSMSVFNSFYGKHSRAPLDNFF